MPVDPVQEAVRVKYAQAAQRIEAQGSCCGAGCCGDQACGDVSHGNYAAGELAALNVPAGVSLGCGNPTLLAALRPGEVVLDLGSGAGLDVLLSARRVAPGGHAYGVDMTDEMLSVAEAHRARAGVANATFLKGSIAAVPLPDASVDVVLSNCVINLAEDKAAVVREAFRVLTPGGRLAVADMVELEPLPEAVKQALDAWAGCIAGTIPVEEYRQTLAAAGFTDIEIEIAREVTAESAGLTGAGKIGSAYIRARR
jgi:SAM-dependent methyltransferase